MPSISMWPWQHGDATHPVSPIAVVQIWIIDGVMADYWRPLAVGEQGNDCCLATGGGFTPVSSQREDQIIADDVTIAGLIAVFYDPRSLDRLYVT